VESSKRDLVKTASRALVESGQATSETLVKSGQTTNEVPSSLVKSGQTTNSVLVKTWQLAARSSRFTQGHRSRGTQDI